MGSILRSEKLYPLTHGGTITHLRRNDAEQWLQTLLGLLFPPLSNGPALDRAAYDSACGELAKMGSTLLTYLGVSNPESLIDGFFTTLPAMLSQMLGDVKAIFEGDPAARSHEEVIMSYPGFVAIAVYRIANYFYKAKVPTFPRIMSEFAHRQTGIDIHPGATIGDDFCIDHGTGIVIGETTIIGKNVKIYQGVTLGGLSVFKHLANSKRHPTVEDDVVIYANATVLGGETVIGKGSIIGGNVWLTQSVPPQSRVYCKSEIELKVK